MSTPEETPLPIFGAVEDLMLGILRPFFQGHPVSIETTFHGDMRLPAVVPIHTPQSSQTDMEAGEQQFMESAVVELNTFSEGLEAERDNAQLQQACKHALMMAQRKQLVVSGVGSINRVQTLSTATPQQGMGAFTIPSGVSSYQSRYRLLLRPDSSAPNPFLTPAS